MKEEKIKQAFTNVKRDIEKIHKTILEIKLEISEIKQTFYNPNSSFDVKINQDKDTTNLPLISTHLISSTDNPTVPQEIGGLKTQNLSISTGNQGVSTDRQTDRQTDKITSFNPHNNSKNIENSLQEASKILKSLDGLKKEIRNKFKKITPQEMLVFSTIYQLEEQNPSLSNYKEISIKLNLSESSIRDYVQRMIVKGVPIKKQKMDNKRILLSISSELKKIAPLSTIIQLRDL